ncbi:MAG: hypothetical protein ACQER9_02100 [Nanobdellota archaeon]
MEFISDKEIVIKKELSELDKFTLNFIKILEKYTKYVIVSGYVSILLGRSRASEDIDIIIPILTKEIFLNFTKKLEDSGFYCLNTDNSHEMYDYLKEKSAIRFARNDTVIPNIELKFSKRNIEEISLKNKIKIIIGNNELFVSPLELQIAFKENVLKSDKDMEDARHIRNVAKDIINELLIDKYKVMLNGFY